MHPLEQLMRCAVRIEARLSRGSVATGSGFAYRFAEQEGGLHIPAISGELGHASAHTGLRY